MDCDFIFVHLEISLVVEISLAIVASVITILILEAKGETQKI